MHPSSDSPDLRDPDAFEHCYRWLAPAARAAATAVLRDPHGAEDVAHDVFTTLWSRPEVFEPARGSLPALVRLMARSRALDRMRHASTREAAGLRAAAEAGRALAVAASPEEEAIRRETGRAILRQLDRQPAGQRTAVLLHHVAGLSDREVAAATSVPLGTAKSRIRLGARRAAQALAA